MPEFEMQDTTSVERMVLSRAAYGRMMEKIRQLEQIESAARDLLHWKRINNNYKHNTVEYTANMVERGMRGLELAVREYDGWTASEDEVEQIIGDMQAIIRDLKDNDANP